MKFTDGETRRAESNGSVQGDTLELSSYRTSKLLKDELHSHCSILHSSSINHRTIVSLKPNFLSVSSSDAYISFPILISGINNALMKAQDHLEVNQICALSPSHNFCLPSAEFPVARKSFEFHRCVVLTFPQSCRHGSIRYSAPSFPGSALPLHYVWLKRWVCTQRCGAFLVGQSNLFDLRAPVC